MKILKQNKLLKVLSLNFISVGISFVLGVVSSRIISALLGTSGMALIGSFRNFATMVKSIATLGIGNSVVRLFVENKNDKKELSVIYSTFFWIFLLMSGGVGTLVLLLASPISRFLFYTDVYTVPIRFFGLLLPLIVINTFWMAIYNGLEKYRRIVIIQIISNVAVFAVMAVLIWKKNITGGLFSVAIGEVMMVIVTLLFVQDDKEYFKFDLQKVISKKYLKIIQRFSVMALLSGIIMPMTLLLIRNNIVQQYSVHEAGIWDAVGRLSSFYMLFFGSGLSMYYMPKLASINTEKEFRIELKSYFKVFVPLFLLMLIIIYITKGLLISIAFTEEFSDINSLIIWQLAGDFFRIMTLAFGFQILVKTMLKRYFISEIVFNLSYLLLSFYLMKYSAVEGTLQAYFYTNVLSFALQLFMFRKLLVKAN